MTITRYYLMIAKEGQTDCLREALLSLGAKVKELDGCTGVELYQDAMDTLRFHFLEFWDSVDAHRAAGEALGKDAFMPVIMAVSQKPSGSYLNRIAP